MHWISRYYNIFEGYYTLRFGITRRFWRNVTSLLVVDDESWTNASIDTVTIIAFKSSGGEFESNNNMSPQDILKPLILPQIVLFCN